MMNTEIRRAVIPELLDANTGDDGVHPNFPFVSSEYSHIHSLDVSLWDSEVLDDIVTRAYAIPADVYCPSRYREGGLDIWDRAAGIPACKWRTVIGSMREGTRSKSISPNDYTKNSTLESLSKISPVSGGWRRPNHPFIMDLPSFELGDMDGYDVLCLASTMAQHEMIHVPDGPLLVDRLRTWIARIHVAHVLGLPVFSGEWDWYRHGDMFPPHGIIVTAGKVAENPDSSIPVSGMGSPVPDKTVMVIGVGVRTGPLPNKYVTGDGKTNDLTVFSCSPMISVIAGWEFIDVVTHFPIIERDISYLLKWEDLQSPVLLVSHFTEDTKLPRFVNSDVYRGLYNSSMPHPPEGALTVPFNASLGLGKPRGSLPENLDPKNGHHKEWIDYIGKLRDIRKVISEASESRDRKIRLECSKVGVVIPDKNKRTSIHNKLIQLRKSRDYYEKRSEVSRKKGYITKAEEYAKKAESKKEEIANITEAKV